MSNRRIQDERGTTWDVWDVFPGDVVAGSYDRRSPDRPAPDRLRTPTPTSSLSVQPELENGWLCFQSAVERRRFAPIPADWITLSDDALLELLETATRVASSKDIRPTTSPME
jgi:hypothetical protein